MPIKAAHAGFEGPVGGLGVFKNHPGIGVFLAGRGPHVARGEVCSIQGSRIDRTQGLQLFTPPLVGDTGVVQRQIRNHPHAAGVGGVKKMRQLFNRTEIRVRREEIRDVITPIVQRRGEKWRQPQTINTQPLQIIKAGFQTLEISYTVAVGILESAHKHLIKHCVFTPV